MVFGRMRRSDVAGCAVKSQSADMNSDLKESAHPAFVEIIKEMTPADARVLSLLRHNPQLQFRLRLGSPSKWNELTIHYSFEVEHLSDTQVTTSISNLERLGLVQVRWNEYPIRDELEEKEKKMKVSVDYHRERLAQIRKGLEMSPDPNAAEALKALPAGGEVFLAKNGLYLTPLGTTFAQVCLAQES